MSHGPPLAQHSPWPRRLAWLLACATFPLVWVGGLVTTTDAGMAVPDWPGTYGYNLFLYPWQTWLAAPWDLFIEHGHRLLAATVGMLTIALLVSLWRCDERRWMRQLGMLALALVVAQGVLGGMRVIFDQRLLAMIHGITGPLFFGVTVALVVLTSNTWRTNRRNEAQAQATNLHALAMLTVAFVLFQVALGAAMRHIPVGASATTFATMVQFHLLLAGVLTLQVLLVGWLVWRISPRPAVLGRLAAAMVLLIAAQLGLGAATWAVKYSVAPLVSESSWLATYTIQAESWLQTHIVTAHVAVGSLMLAMSLALAMFALHLVPARRRTSSVNLLSLLEVAA